MMRTLADRVVALQAEARASGADKLLGLVETLDADALALLGSSTPVSVCLGRLRDAARGCGTAIGRTERATQLAVFEAALYRLAMAADGVALDEAKAASYPDFDRSSVPNPLVRPS